MALALVSKMWADLSFAFLLPSLINDICVLPGGLKPVLKMTEFEDGINQHLGLLLVSTSTWDFFSKVINSQVMHEGAIFSHIFLEKERSQHT